MILADDTDVQVGYRHFDTAAGYGGLRTTAHSFDGRADAAYLANEQEVGRAVRDSKVPRSEIFITTKLWWAFTKMIFSSIEKYQRT
jgi:diketogulonate reductase-like aldo/keto reductase